MCSVNEYGRRNITEAWAEFTIDGQSVYAGDSPALLGLPLWARGNLGLVFLEEETLTSEEAAALCSPAHLPVHPSSQHFSLTSYLELSCVTLGK